MSKLDRQSPSDKTVFELGRSRSPTPTTVHDAFCPGLLINSILETTSAKMQCHLVESLHIAPCRPVRRYMHVFTTRTWRGRPACSSCSRLLQQFPIAPSVGRSRNVPAQPETIQITYERERGTNERTTERTRSRERPFPERGHLACDLS